MTKIITALLITVLTTQAKALTSDEEDYFTISKITVEEIPDQAPLKTSIKTYQKQIQSKAGFKFAKELEVEVDTIINIGKKIWSIVEDGQPVVHVEVNSASAVPSGITNWQQLTGWKVPRSSTYQVHYTNNFGMNVVDFSYRVMFTYGGSFKGQGHYVTGATIVPAALDVAWGFTFKANVEIPTVVNMGDEKNPIGGIQMNVNWNVSTVIKNSQTRASYFVDGTGDLRQLN